VRRDRVRRLSLHAGGRRGAEILRRGELVGALSGLGLLVVSFLPWYSAGGEDATAWQAFSVVDLVMAAAAAAALSVGIAVIFHVSVSYPVAGSSVTALFGLIALICVIVRLIDPPGSGEVSREVGAWLGLVAVAGVAWGGYVGMQEPRAEHDGPARTASAG
jgi:hypothetical protein